MVDFLKKIRNSDKFREPALLFIATGHYCLYPAGTSEYYQYWDEQLKRCIDGYTAADGDYISGYNYFYINFCPIQRIVHVLKNMPDGSTRVVKNREVLFPDFYDYDYYYYEGINEAEAEGKHMVVLKSRRKGYSYKAASMACRNYYLIPGSKTYIYVSNKQYLTEDGIMTKVGDYMDFIDKNTAWGKKRSVNTTLRKRSGFYTKDEFGNEVEMGYKSEIIGVSLKDNASVVRGKAGKLIIFEEAGSFAELAAAWQIARPSVEQDGVAFGLMLAFGTGGDEGSNFATLKDMFYNPEGYNCLGFENIWDDAVTGKECGFFVPQYTNLDVRDENGKRVYMDEDGNTLRKEALAYILEDRRKVIENATSSTTVDRYVAERCLTPQEACLEFAGNIFPKKELQEQLSLLRTNKNLANYKQVGDLVFDEANQLKWIPKKTGDITHYPLNKNDDPTGSIVIWEHPNKEASAGLYIAGCLLPGELVLTSSGYKAVETVSFNDWLVNKDGKLDKIVNLQRYYKEDEDTYEIRVSHSYSTTTFTKEHPIYTAKPRRNGYGLVDEAKLDFSFNKVSEISEGDWIKVPNYYKKENQFDIDLLWDNTGYRIDRQIKSPLKNKEFWWFVGLWLGDGYNVGKYRVTVVFNSAETLYIERFKRLHELFNRSYSIKERPDSHSVELTYNFQQLNAFMLKHFGKYAAGKRIPEWVKMLPVEYKVALLQGYLDSDGCVYQQGKYSITGFVSINLKLLEDIQDIMFSMGLIGNMSRLRGKSMHNICGRMHLTQPCYLLRMAHHDSVKFKSFFHDSDLKLNKIQVGTKLRTRPKDGCFFDATGDYIYFKIREIKKSKYTGWVYNFECESHTYMCRHITTHNCDPYDHDQSTTTSLGSCFIYKRVQNLEQYSDIIVAEYTGRPESSEDFYENVRKLLIYYDARLMYENQNKGLFVYFTQKHCDYLLADLPDIINDVVGNSKVNRKKGCHLNKQIKLWGEGLIKEWLNDINADGRKNLYHILSEPLLEELISYNDVGNFDRICSLLLVMVYREQLFNVVVKKKEKENKSRMLFDGPIFAQNWFEDKPQSSMLDDNVYTFGT